MSKLQLHNPFGVACVCLLVFFFPALGILASVYNRIQANRILRKQQLARILPAAAQSFRPVDHVHQIDYHRSGPVVTDSGAVFVRCALAGCEEGIMISENLTAVWKITPPPAPATRDLFFGRVRG